LEYQQLMQEITRIADNTEWNGMNILNNEDVGTGGLATAPASAGSEVRNVKFQVGANADQTISIALKDFSFGTGTPAVASKSEINFASIGGLATAVTSFQLTLNGSVNVTANLSTAIAGTAATSAEVTSIFDALKTAVANRSGFENVEITKAGNVIKIEDSQGRAIGALSASNGGAFVATTAAAQTAVAAGSVATGATTPAATSVFSGTAQINDTSITDSLKANDAIGHLDNALKNVNNERATMGSVINRLTYAVDNLANVSMNTSQSRSRVLDTDYAKASAELARTQIISQAATAMLAQANQQPQSVLQLLQG
jgi:flagellin